MDERSEMFILEVLNEDVRSCVWHWSIKSERTSCSLSL